MSDNKRERFFNVRVSLGAEQGAPSEPFDPLPWLRYNIKTIEQEGLQSDTMHFTQLRNHDGTITDGAVEITASFQF